MRCSVVIPCHNGKALTERCLDSLFRQDDVQELEILLVDNASSDGTAELSGLAPAIRCLRQSTNLGFAGGVNEGIRAARHAIVVVLNNDTQAASNLLAELHRTLVSDPRIGAAAPVSNFVKGAARLDIGPGARDPAIREAVARELQGTGLPDQQDVDSLAGLCLMVRRETFAEVGLFDERFGHGNFEDDDFCLRLRLRGYRLVIARRAFLHHEGHATFHALGLDVRSEIRQREQQFAAKWIDDPAGAAMLASAHGDRARAAALAETSRELWPHWPDADWHLGRHRLTLGDFEVARHHFEALLAACPRHSDAALEIGLCWLFAGDTERAQRQLQWTAEHCYVGFDKHIDLLRRIGEHWFRLGRWAEAASNFREAVTLAPGDGELHNWLGSCLLEAGDVDAAARAFWAATQHGFDLAFTNLGICEFRRGNLPDAAAHFATACQRLPNDPVASKNQAAYLQQAMAISGRRLATSLA